LRRRGLYLFYVPYLLEALFKIKPSERTGELYLTDAVDYMVRKGYEIRSFMASDPTEIVGVNTRWELSFAENVLRLKLIKFWSQRGVTFHTEGCNLPHAGNHLDFPSRRTWKSSLRPCSGVKPEWGGMRS